MNEESNLAKTDMGEKGLTDARRLGELAAEINTIKRQTQKIMFSAALEIGKRLREAKTKIGHGNWEEWLGKNVDYSQRTATNLIRIFEEYGLKNEISLFSDGANQQAIADLSYTQAVALLGIKDSDERAEFINNNDVAGMTTRELEAAIKERDEARRERDAANKENDSLMKRFGNTQKELNETRDKLLAARKELQEGEDAAKKKVSATLDRSAKERETAIKERDEAIEERNRLYNEKNKAEDHILEREKRIRELEKELAEMKERPPVTVETMQPDPDEAAVTKAKICFVDAREKLNAMMAAVDAISDEATRAKYKRGMSATADKICGAIRDWAA